MSTGRPLQQQQNNVKVTNRQVLRRTQPKVSPTKYAEKKQQAQQQQQQQHEEERAPLVRRPSPILKKVSSFDHVDICSPVSTDNGTLEYQSPLRKDGLIMDPPTPLFFSFTYGLYSDSNSTTVADNYEEKSNGIARNYVTDEESLSSCCSTVDDPSPPPRNTTAVCEVKKKKVTFAVPEAVTFTEKEVAPSPRLALSPGPARNFNSISKVQQSWKRQGSPKAGRIAPEGLVDLSSSNSESGGIKRCAWITAQSDPAYIEYHDSEWGVPVHDDKKLFELLVFSGAQAELSWSGMLAKREHYRAAFAGFDAEIVSKFDEEKIAALAADPEILQHEGKLRHIIDNAKCIVEVVQEFGSFDKFIWNFFSQRPIVNRYKTPQQVPIKSAKSDYISRDLMKRGFRFVGPTIMYSFMQAAGMTNDHLLQCFRHEECIALSQNQASFRGKSFQDAPVSDSSQHNIEQSTSSSSSPSPSSSST